MRPSLFSETRCFLLTWESHSETYGECLFFLNLQAIFCGSPISTLFCSCFPPPQHPPTGALTVGLSLLVSTRHGVGGDVAWGVILPKLRVVLWDFIYSISKRWKEWTRYWLNAEQLKIVAIILKFGFKRNRPLQFGRQDMQMLTKGLNLSILKKTSFLGKPFLVGATFGRSGIQCGIIATSTSPSRPGRGWVASEADLILLTLTKAKEGQPVHFCPWKMRDADILW